MSDIGELRMRASKEPSETWFAKYGGKVRGPFAISQLVSLANSGQLTRDDLVSCDRQTWVSAVSVTALRLELNAVESKVAAQAKAGRKGPPPLPSNRHSSSSLDLEIISNPQGVEFHYVRDQAIHGPISLAVLQERAIRGKLLPTDMIWFPGAKDWLAASDLADISFPPRSPFHRLSLGMRLAVVLAVSASLIVVVYAIFAGRNDDGSKQIANSTSDDTPDSFAERSPFSRSLFAADASELGITGVDDMRLERGVGLVVCGFRLEDSLGVQTEVPFGTGSCFCVTSDGYLLTNRHVIKDIATFQSQHPSGTSHRGYVIVAKVWVFFGKGSKHVADIRHVSDKVDVAVLKVDSENCPFFRMSNTSELRRSTSIYALGFPGAAALALSEEELVEQVARKTFTHRDVQDEFKSRDFDFSSISGTIGRVTHEANGCEWLQHNANLHPGNSGGPLITSDGTVVGINTLRSKDAPGLNYALTLPQIKKELEAYVPVTQWK